MATNRKSVFRGETVEGWFADLSGSRRWMNGPVDEFGNEVRRTKQSHPYSYDGFVLHRLGPNTDITGTVYTDRLRQWDAEKYERCRTAHMDGLRWDNAPPAAIQAFMRDYHSDDGLRLVLVMEYCNQASGYPVWRIDYASTPAPSVAEEPSGGTD